MWQKHGKNTHNRKQSLPGMEVMTHVVLALGLNQHNIGTYQIQQ